MTRRKSAFDTMAEKYDAWYDSDEGRLLYDSEAGCVRGLVPEGGPLLEVGVGTGRFASLFPGAFGVDPARGALALAALRGVRVVEARGEALPFRDESFAVVLIIATLGFVDDPLEALREAERVLEKDGSIVVGLIPADSPWGRLYRGKKEEGHPFYGDSNLLAFEDLVGLLNGAGLRVAGVRSTLLHGPEEGQERREVAEGYVEGAGFVCVEAVKKCSG